MSDSMDSTELCRSGDYRIVRVFDMALLKWPYGELIVGDHCRTDPQCAVINAAGGWCVSAGQGLEICLFEDGLPQGPDELDPNRVRRLNLWRDQNPPPNGEEYWFVSKIWLDREDFVGVAVGRLDGEVNLYQVDVRSLRWKQL